MRCILFTVAIALFMGVVAQPAHAFSLFGIHLWGEKEKTDDDVIGEPKFYSVDVKAAPNASEDGIGVVKSASSLIADEDKAASGSAGLLVKARGDYQRILAALYAQGRYGGVVSIKVNGREAADLAADTDLPETSEVVITIDQGPEYTFSQALVTRLAPSSEDGLDIVETLKEAGYAAGETARSSNILKTEALAVSAWRQQGHAKAQVVDTTVVADHATRQVAAEIEVEPGPIAYYDEVKVRNVSRNPRMDSAYVAWMTGLKPGEQYNPEDIKKANDRLSRLGVFRAATVREGRRIEEDGTLPLNLVVQERPLRRFGVGGSYSTLDGAGFEAYWMHRNLFGHAESLRFDASISGIGGDQDDSYDPANFSYSLGATFKRPGVYTPDTDFIAALGADREVLDNYTQNTYGGRLGFTHIFNDQLSGRIFTNLAYAQTEDDYFGKREFMTFGFLGGLLYDSRDNKTDAKNGLYGETVFEPVYEARYGNFISKLTVEGRGYMAFGESERTVLASRLKVGSIVGADISELPSNMLFFAGGGGSVRGYGYRNIGIKTETGDTIGGRSLIEGSVELRQMVTNSIGLVGFVDAGSVSRESYPSFSEDLRLGAGVGLRYVTGLGPMRLDLAVPLDKQSGDPDLGFYIGIGQAF